MLERVRLAFACAALAVVALALGCASLTLRGGNFSRAQHEPRGTLVARYVPRDCRDARGTPSAYPAEIDLVRLPHRGLVLLERRPGYDSLIFENSFVKKRMRVFQLVLRGSSAPELLHETRIPLTGRSPGELRVADKWSETSLAEGGFRAHLESVSLHCALEPMNTRSDAGAREAGVMQPAPAPAHPAGAREAGVMRPAPAPAHPAGAREAGVTRPEPAPAHGAGGHAAPSE